LRPLIGVADRLALAAARLGMAAIVLLFVLMLFEVVARYGFAAPTVWGSDLAAMVNASIFLLGAAWTLRQGGHIRIDVLSSRLPALVQNLVNAAAYLGLLVPVLAVLCWVAWRTAISAYRTGAIDLAAAWRVPVWPFAVLIAACLSVLLLQVLAEAAKHLAGTSRGNLPPSISGSLPD
jgi:TRAP-type mannitol/chloroaromatic compound transport system permease small subunit